MHPLVLAILLACTGGEPAAPVDCSSIQAGQARDACLSQRIAAAPPSQAQQVLSDAQAIEDPMMRGAAVSRWVEGNAGDLPTDQGQALCELLASADQRYCLRRLSTPHLQ